MMSFQDSMNAEVLISSNNILSKVEKEKKKDLWKFLGTSYTVFSQNRICNYIDQAFSVEIDTKK